MNLALAHDPVLAAEPAAEGFIARQPILDRAQRLTGFELFYRPADGTQGRTLDTARSTANLLSDLFATVGLNEVLGSMRGFVNADAVFVNSSLVELLPPDRVVLELSETVECGGESLHRLQQLRSQGYRLAADHYWGEKDRIAPLLPLLDFVKVDLEWVEPAALGMVVRPFQAGRLRLVATKVESAAQFQLALAHGFELFQGYHFAHPETIRGTRAPVDVAGMMRLLSLVSTDSGDERLEEEFKRQPAMSVNLLRLVNSASARAKTPVKSLREAVFRLGRRPLSTWLQLLLYTSGGGSAGNPLLHTAALRGKLMELLAREIEPNDDSFAESALMVGILSLMHVVFGQTQPEFAARLGLEITLREALDARRGRIGKLLATVEQREAGKADASPLVHPAIFARLEVEALRWATGVSEQSSR
jgi:c-di-GMP-related signal transduction protein